MEISEVCQWWTEVTALLFSTQRHDAWVFRGMKKVWKRLD